MKLSKVICICGMLFIFSESCSRTTNKEAEHVPPIYMHENFTDSTKYLNTDCSKGSLISPLIVDSIFNVIFQKGGNIEAYGIIKNFYSYYKKEYLLLSMYMKYSNLFNSPQASFDVYCTLSNFLEKDYMKAQNDRTSRKIAFFYLWRCYKMDSTDVLVKRILQKSFGAQWLKYQNVDFLSFDTSQKLPELIKLDDVGG